MIIQQKIRSPYYEWPQSVSKHELTQNSQDLPSPIKLQSYKCIKEQKSITLVPCKVVKISGSLKSGSQSPWFAARVFSDMMRFVASKGFLGVLVSAPRAENKNQGHWKIIAGCSNKKDVEMVTSLLYSLLACY